MREGQLPLTLISQQMEMLRQFWVLTQWKDPQLRKMELESTTCSFSLNQLAQNAFVLEFSSKEEILKKTVLISDMGSSLTASTETFADLDRLRSM